MAHRIVGRDEELAEVDEFLRTPGSGYAALILGGEAGIGKTAVWLEGLATAPGRGYRVLSARPTPSEATFSFAGLSDLLEGVEDETFGELPEPQRNAINAALLREPPKGRAPDHRAVAVGVLGILRALARASPVLVAVDDIQWLDRASSAVLEFTFRRLDTAPVRLLASLRSGESRRDDFSRQGDTGRLRHLVLRPLTTAAIHHLVAERLGLRLGRSALVRVHTASGGNPFFALEMARMLLTKSRASLGAEVPVPESLAELVRGRLTSLAKRDRQVLLAVSALARPTVQDVVRTFPPSVRAGAALRRAVDGGLIEQTGDRIRFSHPLLGSVLYADAPRGDRRTLHRRLAVAVTDPEERARHLALAASGPDSNLASSLDEVAREALTRGAPHAAAELLDMAAQLTPISDRADFLRRTVEQAEAHFQAGDAVRARELFEQVAAELPPGPSRAYVLSRLGMVRADEESWLEAGSLFERALIDAGDDPSLRRITEQGLGYVHLFCGDLSGSRAHATAALAAAEASGEPAALAESLSSLGFVEFVLGNGIGSDLIERGKALEEQLETWPSALILRPSFTFAQILKYTDRLVEAGTQFRALLEVAKDRGQEHAVGALLYHLAELECRVGDWDAAARHAAESVAAAEQTGMLFFAGMADYAHALVAAHLGDAAAARAAGERGLAVSGRTGVVLTTILNLGALGFLELSLGEASRALGYLGKAADLASEMNVGDPGYFHFLPDQAEALVELGRLDEAEALIKSFEERGAKHDRPWAMATAARCVALLEAAPGDFLAATRSISRAMQEHERLGQPFELGRTLLSQGRINRRAKQKRAAREALSQALETFDGLGAILWARKAREELGRIGGRSPGVAALTPTEQMVASLAAKGMTNREIADHLFLTVRTVEWNLSKVYRKLQVRSRTELAQALK
jgi:DNA-binding CsgD family transcriptional regulator